MEHPTYYLIDFSKRDCGLYTRSSSKDFNKLVTKLNKNRVIMTLPDVEHVLNMVEPELRDVDYGAPVTLDMKEYPFEALIDVPHYIAFNLTWEKAARFVKRHKNYFHFQGTNKDVDIYCTQFHEGPNSRIDS